MAITLDTFTSFSGVGTHSFTCTGTNLILVVAAFGNTGDGSLTGLTYNGVALTSIGREYVSGTSGQYTELWWLIAPSTGSHNLVASGTDSFCLLDTVSFAGADQSNQPDATAKN